MGSYDTLFLFLSFSPQSPFNTQYVSGYGAFQKLWCSHTSGYTPKVTQLDLGVPDGGIVGQCLVHVDQLHKG